MFHNIDTIDVVNEAREIKLKYPDYTEGLNINFNECLNNKAIEDFVLNDRIEGVKKFKVNATPTIIINGKKFEKTLNYKNLKKSLEKLI